ncbi:alpha/beta hydrolase [Shewanella salipaludis]|uniref:Alpha/beta hydrolase n=1 Tax=Shewanella salipaludis TaxID=2723052 RepID=A0A972FU43_9GAMM|nr:alpha/beta hydrolase [Shewanella salipaludis]NMH65329.1 alpha/beta hydrolase [Shewanella salipaludis]
MPSWQGAVFNALLSYLVRPCLGYGKARGSLPRLRLRLLALDRRWLAWPAGLETSRKALSQSELLYYPSMRSGESREARGSLFYIRGGGFCFKTPHAHARMLAELGLSCDTDIYVPDYRLAPEHPFPAALDDVLEAYIQVLSLESAARLVLMGDSAGGNLALSLLLELKRRHLPMPRACVLISPALDLALTGDIERMLGAKDPFFSLESLLRLRGAYLAGADPMAPAISPLLGDLCGLPAILVIAGTRELLLQDSQRLLDKVGAAGGDIRALFYPNMPHVFPLVAALPEAVDARLKICEFIRDRLQG